MTLLIPLLLRLTALFERGVIMEEPSADEPSLSEEMPDSTPEKE